VNTIHPALERGLSHRTLSGRYSRSKKAEQSWLSNYQVGSEYECFYGPSRLKESGELAVTFSLKEALGEARGMPGDPLRQSHPLHFIQEALGVLAILTTVLVVWRLWINRTSLSTA